MAEFSRGFVFSADALLAAITMGVMLMALLYMSSQASEGNAASMLLRMQAGDALAVLDKSGALASGNLTLANGTLSQLFPFADWSMDLQYYNYTGSEGFALAGQVALGQEGRGEAQVAERRFASPSNGSVRHYGVARLRVWAEK
jgi:hypothetical protein